MSRLEILNSNMKSNKILLVLHVDDLNVLAENIHLLIHIMYLIRMSLYMAIRCSSCKLFCCVCFVITDELINILFTISDGSDLNV